MGDAFWGQFRTAPVAETNQSEPDFDADTERLVSLCKELCAIKGDFHPIVQELQQVSDTFGFESPLTPPPNPSRIGESFDKYPITKCVCGQCTLRASDDFYEGKCGACVLCKSPYSFVHVNLSRKLSSTDDLLELVRPLFKADKVRLRMVPGDSGCAAVFLTRDAAEERQIRRILRSEPVRIQKGIRIFLVDKTNVIGFK